MSAHLDEHPHDHAHGQPEHHDTQAHEPSRPPHDAGLVNEGMPLYREPESQPAEDRREVARPEHQTMPDAVEHAGNAHPTAQEGAAAAPGGDVYRDLELTPPAADQAGAGTATAEKGLEQRTVVELRKLAGELKIPNRSRLSKVALIEAIRQKQG